MNITINGKQESISEVMNIAELLAVKGVNASRVVVEHNCRILHRQEWPEAIIRESDSVEIISFMGGG